MTASPAGPGMPSEVEIARIVSVTGAIAPRTLEKARAILSLIRPAFEAQQAKLAQAVEEEREACARVAERCALNPRGRRYSDFGAAREDIAEAIRVRSAASDIRGEKT